MIGAQEPTLAPDTSRTVPDVRVRRFPFPHKAMLAICSDLDETPDRHVYREIMRFLNTTQTTPMGPGLGLEVGNTIYFDMPSDQFAYWNTDDAGRSMVRSLIHSGHIDCLHSYGDLAATRDDAARALDELARHDCKLRVWVDHAVAPTNFGPDIMHGRGDLPGAEAYHADLTCDYGIRYVWRGRVTSVVGQDVAPRMSGLWSAHHPLTSSKTVLKECAKQLAIGSPRTKYGMHRPNRVLSRCRLRDGREVYEFLRSNPHWGGVSSADTGRRIGEVLSSSMLDRLIEREGASVLYTHLGKIDDPDVPICPEAAAGFRRLADRCRAGQILALTTNRLLTYIAMRDSVAWTARSNGVELNIDVQLPPAEEPLCDNDEKALAGLSFYVPDGVACRLTFNGKPLDGVRLNEADHTGRRSLSVPMSKLEFPDP